MMGLQVKLQASQRGSSSFLPTWLTSPLGMSASAAGHHQAPALNNSLAAAASLNRHSADALRDTLRPTGKPLLRSVSEVCHYTGLMSSCKPPWDLVKAILLGLRHLKVSLKLSVRRRPANLTRAAMSEKPCALFCLAASWMSTQVSPIFSHPMPQAIEHSF